MKGAYLAPFFMLHSFITYLSVEKRYSEHTIGAYERDLLQFIDYAEIKEVKNFGDLSSTFIRGWIVHLFEQQIKAKSINRKLAALRTYYKWLRKELIVTVNPMSKIQGPKNEKRLPAFAKESELDSSNLNELYADSLEGIRDKLMVELFYQTGIRLSELIELRVQNVTNESIKVLGKRNKERIIPISSELAKQLNSFIHLKNRSYGESAYVFSLKFGKKLYPMFVYRKINQYLSMATSLDKKSPHVLRHTFATHMLNRGAGLETLKDLLGHANLSATQVYTHNSFAQLTSIYSQTHPRGGKK
jgi:integrase/recombinase XerC